MVSNWPPEAPEPSHLSAEVDPDMDFDTAGECPKCGADVADPLLPHRLCQSCHTEWEDV